MKLSQEFPNFYSELLFFISDKNPVLASDDAKKLSYFICLSNFKAGYDYYELDRISNDLVRFSLITTIGIKTVVQTNSDLIPTDLSKDIWNDIIYRTALKHFGKEEYVALKNNYVKKTNNYSGCVLTLLLFVTCTSLIFITI